MEPIVMRLRSLFPTLPALAAGLALAVTGCAAPDDASTGSAGDEPSGSVQTLSKDEAAAAKLPADIADSGVVRVASGVSFPPMEYFDTDNKTVLGFDADLGKALGQVLGVKFAFSNTNFDGIIGGLKAGRYDLSLTSMIDKKERQVDVDFVDYLNSGVTFMTVKGNPDGLTKPSDLCGRTVAVEKSATGDIVADDISAQCAKDGKPKVKKTPFPDQASAVQALKAGRADAVMALDLTLAYNVKQDPGSFEVPAKPFGQLPVGIPVPKSNPELRDAVQAALLEVQESGAYDELLAKWNLDDQALTGAPINTGK
jgi:polar amino acid transport system substrate-binding protein